MRQRLIRRERAHTAHVNLDTHVCEACWKCITVCPEKVIGRINLPWHKHALITNPSACIGCLKCVKICSAKAIVKLT